MKIAPWLEDKNVFFFLVLKTILCHSNIKLISSGHHVHVSVKKGIAKSTGFIWSKMGIVFSSERLNHEYTVLNFEEK